MKSLLVRSGLALLCATILAACGGGNGGGSLLLSGAIQTLTKGGLVLTNGSETVTPAAGDTSFQFPNLIAVNDNFNIIISTQPTGAHCTIANNTNSANIYTVSQTVVTCTTNTGTLGGVVTGLKSTGLLISNGSDIASVAPPATPGAPVSFTFPVAVADGAPYGVKIFAQPQTGNCSIATSNGVGTMPAGSYAGLIVTCN